MKRFLNTNIFLISLFVFVLGYSNCMGQKNEIKPLHLFLQKNADSTLIFKYESNWMTLPEYWVISKKNDTITRYRYKFDDRRARMPKSVRDTLSKINPIDLKAEYKEIYSVGINKYFNALYTDNTTIKAFWGRLQRLSPWTINDDSVEGWGCPPNEKGEVNQIYDGGGISLFLISKKEIKHLSFYAPDFYNKVCPGKKGRQAILQIEELFKDNFK
ncbi:hypothetical protein [Pedobacter nanyangensis]|uniref:hypothetical protein n=1 Tax=Pedobacter nanyangensis TaxID=1562389 RepID=UPI001964F497|nr:hypothetical protein [Pedobacter nanyangensis]